MYLHGSLGDGKFDRKSQEIDGYNQGFQLVDFPMNQSEAARKPPGSSPEAARKQPASSRRPQGVSDHGLPEALLPHGRGCWNRVGPYQRRDCSAPVGRSWGLERRLWAGTRDIRGHGCVGWQPVVSWGLRHGYPLNWDVAMVSCTRPALAELVPVAITTR